MPAIDATGASWWRLEGLSFESTPNGEGEMLVCQDSSQIAMDRLLMVAGEAGQKRAIRGNGEFISLTRSHIANIWRTGQDSQAFCAWDGAGPYVLQDNYLEAASENVMFGGANSASPDRIPADILVEDNHLSKPIAWKGQPRAVKNLFELKSAKRVTVRNNLFERNWTDAQNGFAILFTVRNDEGGSPWSVVEDVLFGGNTIRDVEQGINVLGFDSYQPSGQTTRITIQNNIIETPGHFLQIGSEVGDLVVSFNRVTHGGFAALLYAGQMWQAGAPQPVEAHWAVQHWTFRDNTLSNDQIFGDGVGIGQPAIDRFVQSFNAAPPAPEPEPEPPPDPPSDLTPVFSRLAALEASIDYLSKTPLGGTVKQLRQYLQKIPR